MKKIKFPHCKNIEIPYNSKENIDAYMNELFESMRTFNSLPREIRGKSIIEELGEIQGEKK